MALSFLLCSLLLTTEFAVGLNWTVVYDANIFSRNFRYAAVGFDVQTDKICLLGGASLDAQTNLHDYNIDSNVFTDYYDVLSVGIYAGGQTYTQIGDTMYIISSHNAYNIATFQLSTRTLVASWYHNGHTVSIPDGTFRNNNAFNMMCTTHYIDSANTQYLFLIYLKVVLMYDITNDAWISNAMLQYDRRESACIGHNNYLYVIGGLDSNTIEKLDVTGMKWKNGSYWEWESDVITRNWTLISDTLGAINNYNYTRLSRAVAHHHDIYVTSNLYFNGAYIIDTSHNAVHVYTTESFTASRSFGGAASIVVGDTLYEFGMEGEYVYATLTNSSYPIQTTESATNIPTTNIPTTDFPTSYTPTTDFPTTGVPPTDAPTTFPMQNMVKSVFNITATVTDPNLSNEEIIITVNASIKEYFNDLNVKAEYDLTVDEEDIGTDRIILFDLIVSHEEDIDINIGDGVLQDDIQEDLDHKYGDGKVDVVVIDNEDKRAIYDEQRSFFQLITIIMALILCLLILSSLIYAKRTKNDFFKLGALIGASFHFLDTWSDVFFCIQCTFHPTFTWSISISNELSIIFILSVIFIIFPVFISLLQLYSITSKHWNKTDEFRSWIGRYLYQLYLISILSGSSFSGVQLCRSNIFNMELFDIPLNSKESMHFHTKKIYSTILLENLPQLVLAVWYIFVSGQMADSIVFISMGFSVLSIVITIISMRTTKQLVNSQDFYTIDMDIKGTMVISNKAMCRNNVNQIRSDISSILGLEQSLIEITRPSAIPNGLRVHCNIYINNATENDRNCEKLIIDAKNSGKLAEYIKNAWQLSAVPIINNLKYKGYESKQRKKQSVNKNTSYMIEMMETDEQNNTGDKSNGDGEQKAGKVSNGNENSVLKSIDTAKVLDGE